MERYNTTLKGYRFDRLIFLAYFFIIIGVMLAILGMNDFDISPRPYINCESELCINPLYKQKCEVIYSFFGMKVYTAGCNKIPTVKTSTGQNVSITSLAALPRGEYGEKPTGVIPFFAVFSILLLAPLFFMNHYLHNKGKKFDFEMRFSKKHRISMTEGD